MRRRVVSAAVTRRARDALSAAWDSALEIAVATSSEKPTSRSSTPGASGSSWDAATSTPQSVPRTVMGMPTVARNAKRLARLRDRAGGLVVVVDARRPAGLEHQRRPRCAPRRAVGFPRAGVAPGPARRQAPTTANVPSGS